MKIIKEFSELAKSQIDCLISPWKEKFETEVARKDAQLHAHLTKMKKNMDASLSRSEILDTYTIPEALRRDYNIACRAVYNTIKITVDDIESSSRRRNIVDARRFVSSALFELYAYQGIAICMNMVNHTSIINHLNTHKDYLRTNIYYRESHQKFMAEYTRLKTQE